MDVFKKTPFLPMLVDTPLPPTVRLTPDLEKFSFTPLKMLMLLRKRMQSPPIRCNEFILPDFTRKYKGNLPPGLTFAQYYLNI